MQCESCVYYVYDEELDCYSCLVELDAAVPITGWMMNTVWSDTRCEGSEWEKK